MGMEAWETEWLDHQAAWELELVGTPGLFASECHANCLDSMDPAEFVAWYQRQASR